MQYRVAVQSLKIFSIMIAHFFSDLDTGSGHTCLWIVYRIYQYLYVSVMIFKYKFQRNSKLCLAAFLGQYVTLHWKQLLTLFFRLTYFIPTLNILDTLILLAAIIMKIVFYSFRGKFIHLSICRIKHIHIFEKKLLRTNQRSSTTSCM